MSDRFFGVTAEPARLGSHVVTEGFEYHQNLEILAEREYGFAILPEKDARKIMLYRQACIITDFISDDCIYTDELQIEHVPVIYTSCYPVPSMVGGPLLDYSGRKVLGVISHESDDPNQTASGLRGVPLHR